MTPENPSEATESTRIVHVSRPVSPEAPVISPGVQARHEQSLRRFPNLNLSPGEFVISAVKRHPIGIVKIWAIAGAFIALLWGFVWLLATGESPAVNDPTVLYLGVVLVSAFSLLGAVVSTYIYNQNEFFLTNESVVQELQLSLFSRNEQTVSLSNIEDASYVQQGFLQSILNYGSIRLSTEGDETTYRFSYVTNPKEQIAILNNAVEAFKNGRPVVND